MALRNKESTFLTAPQTRMSRSAFPYSQRKIFTCNQGALVPFFVDATIMPGDTFKLNLSLVARMLTPIAPTMDDIYLDTYFFFTPYRLVWDHFKEFYGENTSGAWVQETEYTKPKLILDATVPDPYAPAGTTIYNNSFQVGSVWDYLYGGNVDTITYAEVDALPIRAYVTIYNEWFRDENWIAPKTCPTDDNNIYFSLFETVNGGPCFRIAKYHDLYTSLLPAPQKGTAVTLPLGTTAPVKLSGTNTYAIVRKATDGTVMPASFGTPTDSLSLCVGNNGEFVNEATSNNNFIQGFLDPNGTLMTDLSNATAANINALREAFAYQRIMEKMARGGTRYTEIVKSFWGVNAADSRLQRPEYLGGKSLPLSMYQVPQTSSTDAVTPQGNLAGYLHSATSDRAFTKSFTEHGCVIGLLAIRQKHSYQQGIERQFQMFRKYDNYFPQLAFLGEQAVKTVELYNGDPTTDEIVLGFNEAWYQYRYRQDTVAGYMRSGISGSLDIWHYADYYTSAPTISEAFINETDTYLKRTLAVQENTHQFQIATMVKGTAVREIPLRSIPGLIDHM